MTIRACAQPRGETPPLNFGRNHAWRDVDSLGTRCRPFIIEAYVYCSSPHTASAYDVPHRCRHERRRAEYSLTHTHSLDRYLGCGSDPINRLVMGKRTACSSKGAVQKRYTCTQHIAQVARMTAKRFLVQLAAVASHLTLYNSANTFLLIAKASKRGPRNALHTEQCAA